MRSDFGNYHYGITTRRTRHGACRARGSGVAPAVWKVTVDSVLEDDGGTGGKERDSTAPIHRL